MGRKLPLCSLSFFLSLGRDSEAEKILIKIDESFTQVRAAKFIFPVLLRALVLALAFEIFLAHSTDTSTLQNRMTVLKLLRADRVVSYYVAYILLGWGVNIFLFLTLFYMFLFCCQGSGPYFV